MIKIQEIKSYIPNKRLNTFLKYKKKIDLQFLQKKIGTSKVSRINSHEDIISMCIKAFKKIDREKLKEIKTIILYTKSRI